MSAIAMNAYDPSSFHRPIAAFENARSAFKAVLAQAARFKRRTVLLPAYIGWSHREGSGVFDPVRELGLSYQFYQVDHELRIDLEDLRRQLEAHSPSVLLLIHYFGYIDPGYPKAAELAQRHDAVLVEDEAHAMLTDLVGGACGRLGDVCLFSFHKLLPVQMGGALVVNPSGLERFSSLLEAEAPIVLCQYDLHSMAARRRENAKFLAELLQPLAGRVDPLWGPPGAGEVPQTFPVRISGVSRDKLYFAMNAAGFGVVSLYHTLVSEISAPRYPISHSLSQKVMNLPIHSEATQADIEEMVRYLPIAMDEIARAPGS